RGVLALTGRDQRAKPHLRSKQRLEPLEVLVGERLDPRKSDLGVLEHALYLPRMVKPVEQLDSVIVRFAGDSGDGMQLTGDRFTSETAVLGNDLSTLPDFPAEIRAPAGSLPGVSGFQVHFADHDILTPGDRPNVLVAMNPAALKTNIA